MPNTLHGQPVVNAQRLWDDLMAIAELTQPEQPYTRRSFSPLFVAGREFLAQRFAEAGLDARVDTGGNLIGRLPGSQPDAGTIMLGSHSDTVPGGGRFDGVAGVIAALEVVRALKAQGFQPRHNLEVVDFLAEEPSEFGLSCIGSRAMAGQLDAAMLTYAGLGGETLAQAIERVGGAPSHVDEAKRSDVRAFFELHIEQGPVLEAENIDIGLVTAIVGIRRIEFTFRGQADHAGTTPMHLRRDAAAAAAEAMVFARRLAEQLAEAGDGHFVATTGVVEVLPNAANVVPASARLLMDVRSESPALMERFCGELDVATAEIAKRLRVERDGLLIVSDSLPARCDAGLRSLLGNCAEDLGLSTRTMASGAGHDAAFVSRIAPAAMLFIPCRCGKSHAAEEWAEPEALATGANTLAQAIIRFDGGAQI